jgi:hypothetical protein
MNHIKCRSNCTNVDITGQKNSFFIIFCLVGEDSDDDEYTAEDGGPLGPFVDVQEDVQNGQDDHDDAQDDAANEEAPEMVPDIPERPAPVPTPPQHTPDVEGNFSNFLYFYFLENVCVQGVSFAFRVGRFSSGKS